jgi:hypothetical protein
MVESLQVLVTGVMKESLQEEVKEAGGILLMPPPGRRDDEGRAPPLPRARRPARSGSRALDPVNQSRSIEAAPLEGSPSAVK